MSKFYRPSVVPFNGDDGYTLVEPYRRLISITADAPYQLAVLAWVVAQVHEDTVLQELRAVWQSQQSLEDAIARLGVLGLHPSGLQSNDSGRAMIIAAGGQLTIMGVVAAGAYDEMGRVVTGWRR